MNKYKVYLTINLENYKQYIGVHKEDSDKFDGYIGNGVNIFNPSTIQHPKTNFQQAVKKYGFDKFRRIILAEFDTEEEALCLESLLVNSKYVNRTDTYNMELGGGNITKISKPINQFDLNGTRIAAYTSITEAAEKTGLWEVNISIAVNGKQSYKNCYWSEDETINLKDYRLVTQDKIIYCFNSNAELVAEYSSLSEAAIAFDTSTDTIKNALYKINLYQKHYFSYNRDFKLKEDKDREVYCYDIKGEFIESMKFIECCAKYGLESKKLHRAATSGLTLSGFQWNYNKVIKMPDLECRQGIGAPKKVGQYTLNGQLIKVFDTVTQCKQEFSNVRKVLNGQLSQTKGFVFKYINE